MDRFRTIKGGVDGGDVISGGRDGARGDGGGSKAAVETGEASGGNVDDVGEADTGELLNRVWRRGDGKVWEGPFVEWMEDVDRDWCIVALE